MVLTAQPIKNPPTTPHKSRLGILYASVTSSADILRLAMGEMEPYLRVVSCSVRLEDPCDICRLGCKASMAIIMTLRKSFFFSVVSSQGISEELKAFVIDRVSSLVVERGMIYVLTR